MLVQVEPNVHLEPRDDDHDEDNVDDSIGIHSGVAVDGFGDAILSLG